MYVLRQTHPGRWKTVMKYGMAKEIQKLRSGRHVKVSKADYSRLAILDAMSESEEYNNTIAWAVENRPCAFD